MRTPTGKKKPQERALSTAWTGRSASTNMVVGLVEAEGDSRSTTVRELKSARVVGWIVGE